MKRFLTFAAVFTLCGIAHAADDRSRPNVICILADDLGWGDLSCYGNTFLPSPNPDRLAKSGALFTHFYVNGPVCSPTRSAFMTAQYPARNRIRGHFARLRKLGADKTRPFLLAVRFHKPHLPLVAPQKYWKRYDRAALPLPAQPAYPKDTPALARNHGLKNVHDVAHGPGANYDEATQRKLIHGYSAATNCVDAQIGQGLQRLRELGLEQNTIVVLWGDHGGHLGDLDQWAKSTNFERATRSPLIAVAPGKTRGAACAQLVETVDIFPTLVELAGLPALPLTGGRSFAPLLANPAQPWKEAVYHVFDRPGEQGGKKRNPTIGFAVRTADARYGEWRSGRSPDGRLVAREFYRDSPERPDEIINEVALPELAGRVAEHAKLRRANPGFRQP